MIPYLAAADLHALLSPADVVEVLERAFAARTEPGPARSHVAVTGGDLLLMPAASAQGVGAKLVTVAPGNPARGLPLISGVYVLFSAATLQPRALLEAAALTGLRTAGVSGLATRHLARPEAHRLIVFGAGAQARAHVAAMLAVRPITSVTVVGRTPAGARRFVEDLRTGGIDADVGELDAVGDADIVCTCTTSDRPVLAGRLLPPGVHVNAVGAYRPGARELDTETVRRGRIVVEDRAAALAEAGDLILPIREGAIDADAIVADLHELVGGAAVRRSAEDVTVLKSVGLGIEDLAVAAEAVDRWERAVEHQ